MKVYSPLFQTNTIIFTTMSLVETTTTTMTTYASCFYNCYNYLRTKISKNSALKVALANLITRTVENNPKLDKLIMDTNDYIKTLEKTLVKIGVDHESAKKISAKFVSKTDFEKTAELLKTALEDIIKKEFDLDSLKEKNLDLSDKLIAANQNAVNLSNDLLLVEQQSQQKSRDLAALKAKSDQMEKDFEKENERQLLLIKKTTKQKKIVEGQREKMKKYNKTISDLSVELEFAHGQSMQLSSNLADQTRKNTELTIELRSAKKKSDDLSVQCEKFQTRICESEKIQDDLLKLVKTFESKKDKLKKETHAFKKEIRELTNQKDNLRDERDGLRDERDGLRVEVDTLRHEVHVKGAAIHKLKKIVIEMKEKNDNLENEVTRLESSNNHLKKDLMLTRNENNSLVTVTKILQENIQTLIKEKNTCTEVAMGFRKEKVEAEEKVNKLSDELNSWRRHNLEVTHFVQQLQNRILNLENDNLTLGSELYKSAVGELATYLIKNKNPYNRCTFSQNNTFVNYAVPAY